MILPIPGLRRECSMCYQLLVITHWSIDSDIEPVFTIGSNTPLMIQSRRAELTTKGHCFNCRCDVTRTYIEINDRFEMRSESYYRQHTPITRGDIVLL